MFGTSVRSVTRPIRGYVCFSCLARRNIQLPPQILRFQSTGPAQTSSGAAPSDDSILCTIKEHEKGRNGDGASIESSGSADASRNGGAQIDSSGVSELVAGTAAVSHRLFPVYIPALVFGVSCCDCWPSMDCFYATVTNPEN